MSLIAFIFILCSAFSHASWNFLCKSHRPSPSFMLVLNTATALVLTPFILLVSVQWSALPAKFWFSYAGSVLANVCYSIALGLAYRYGDISVSYPLSRALPVLLTAAVTTLFHIGKVPSPLAYTGLVILFLGCISLPQRDLKSLSLKNFLTPALLPICFAAIGTTSYTISDSVSTRIFAELSTSSKIVVCGSYFFILQVGLSLAQFLIMFLWGDKKNRSEILSTFRQPFPYLAGVFNCVSYLLVLLAMGYVTNVSYVQAFRQIGLPLGVFAGIYFLHEKFTYMKLTGITLIIIGLVLTVL